MKPSYDIIVTMYMSWCGTCVTVTHTFKKYQFYCRKFVMIFTIKMPVWFSHKLISTSCFSWCRSPYESSSCVLVFWWLVISFSYLFCSCFLWCWNEKLKLSKSATGTSFNYRSILLCLMWKQLSDFLWDSMLTTSEKVCSWYSAAMGSN